jgi:hypothetical protein
VEANVIKYKDEHMTATKRPVGLFNHSLQESEFRLFETKPFKTMLDLFP